MAAGNLFDGMLVDRYGQASPLPSGFSPSQSECSK
jgi:hypothetical protein